MNFIKRHKKAFIFVGILLLLSLGASIWYFCQNANNGHENIQNENTNHENLIEENNIQEHRDIWYLEDLLREQLGYEKYEKLSQEYNIEAKAKEMEKCLGKDFVEYRQCLMSEMKKMEEIFAKTDDEKKYWRDFYAGIQFEIDNFAIYNFVDKLPSFLQKKIVVNKDDGKVYDEDGKLLADSGIWQLWPYDENVCFAIGERKFSEKDAKGKYSGYLPNFYLSFGNGSQEKIAKIFPNFQEKIIKTWDEGDYLGKPRSNPCWFRTFGPEIGHILHADENENGQFLFITLEEGSGEFSFGIFFRENVHKKWQFVGDFGMYGTHPFDFNQNFGGTLENAKIAQMGQNRLLMSHWYNSAEKFMIDVNYILEMLEGLN